MNIRWIFLLWFLVSTPLLAEDEDRSHRVAYVNVPWILNNSPQVKDVEMQLKQTFIKREEALRDRQRQLDDVERRLRDAGGDLGDDEARQLERELVSGERRLRIAEEEFQEDVALRKNEEINKLRRQIAEVVQAVAIQRGVDMVFETAVVYASDRVDISEAVLSTLREQHAQTTRDAAPGSGN